MGNEQQKTASPSTSNQAPPRPSRPAGNAPSTPRVPTDLKSLQNRGSPKTDQQPKKKGGDTQTLFVLAFHLLKQSRIPLDILRFIFSFLDVLKPASLPPIFGTFSSPLTVKPFVHPLKKKLKHPRGVAVDCNGNIFVVEQGNHRVTVFGQSGKFRFRFGSWGSQDGQLFAPRGIAIDRESNIVIADSSNNRIQVFSHIGVFKFNFGTIGSDDGQLYDPFAVAVARSGNILVADENHRISIFDKYGKFLWKFGSYGTEKAQFRCPCAITIDNEDSIIVADFFNDRIQIFHHDGTFKNQILLSCACFCVAVDDEGNIAVAEVGTQSVIIFSSKGTNANRSSVELHAQPRGLAIDRKGNLVVIDEGVKSTHGRLQVLHTEPPQ